MRIRYFIAIGLLALGGCNNSKGGGGDDGGINTIPGRACNVDAECGALRCDPIRRQCICLSDADCPNQFCSNYTGQCVDSVPGCTADDQCSAGQFCNPETRACQALRGFCETCNSDPECGPGNHCRVDTNLGESFCSKSCQSQDDCPQGTACTAVGQGDSQCWPTSNRDCTSFRGCIPDLLTSCNQNSDCADANNDQVCDTGSGQCRARVPVCPLGTVCDPNNLVCVNSCSVDRDCTGNLACVNHICQSLSTCESDSDCPADKVCDVPAGASEGSCVPFCSNDTACGVGRVCQPVIEPDGTTRQACLPGCVSNTGCAPDQICEDPISGQPFVPSGTALGQCSSTLGGAQACQSTDACGSCEICGTNNTCSSASSAGYCHPCDQTRGNADCAAFGTTATCLSLAGRDPSGNVLAGGPFACGVPCSSSSTADQAECPKGFVCAALTDGSGNNTGVYNCIPADFNCDANSSAPKCQ